MNSFRAELKTKSWMHWMRTIYLEMTSKTGVEEQGDENREGEKNNIYKYISIIYINVYK